MFYYKRRSYAFSAAAVIVVPFQKEYCPPRAPLRRPYPTPDRETRHARNAHGDAARGENVGKVVFILFGSRRSHRARRSSGWLQFTGAIYKLIDNYDGERAKKKGKKIEKKNWCVTRQVRLDLEKGERRRGVRRVI